MLRSLQALREHASRRRRLAALHREMARELAPAAREPANVTPRTCPVCEAAPPETIALRGPVYEFVACPGCGLLYAPRVLGRKATQRHYAQGPTRRAFWALSREAARADVRRGVYRGLAARLAALAPEAGTVVDVGCSFGALLKELGRKFDTAIGLELDRNTAEAAREDHGVDVRSTRIERLDLPPGSVDLVVMNQVLEHLSDVRRPLEAARRLLRPGGVLWVGIPHGRSLGLRVLGGRHPVIGTHVHVNLFDEGSLKRLAEDLGFQPRIHVTDGVDLGAGDLLRAAGVGWADGPAMALDQGIRRVASTTRWPSRTGFGSHLEAVLVK
jgi:SAM-dependent methyltransferase